MISYVFGKLSALFGPYFELGMCSLKLSTSTNRLSIVPRLQNYYFIEFGSLAPKLDTTIVTSADFSDYYDNNGDRDLFYNYCRDFSFIIIILGIFIIFWKAILTTQRYFSGRRLSLHNDKNIAKIIAKNDS